MAYFSVAGLGLAQAIGPVATASPGLTPALIATLPGMVQAGGQAAGSIMVAREAAQATRRASRAGTAEFATAARQIDPKVIFGVGALLVALWVLTRK